jgi:hypothetical protein
MASSAPSGFVKDERYFSKGLSDAEEYSQGTDPPFYGTEGAYGPKDNAVTYCQYWLLIHDRAALIIKRDKFFRDLEAPGAASYSAIEITD